MLNNEALAELSKLKKIIEDSKDTGEGVVTGTQGRYGFVKLDDGRSIYLPAEAMQRVLPGDRVKIEVVTNDREKSEAKLEKLLQKNFKRFVGTYITKGNNHFVVPDHKETNRGLFVPSKERKKFAQGDFVECELIRHPFTDGKSLVKIIHAIGKPGDAGIDHRLIEAKYQFASEFEAAAQQQAADIGERIQQLDNDREDLSHLPFVTIDADSTLDLDDSLYAEKRDDGWTLYSAIADPSAFIEVSSPLDKEARRRASSVYFPGKVIPMLPDVLATEVFSLVPNQRRPALVCKMEVEQDGKISQCQFFNAIIQSHGKLDYTAVSTFLDNGLDNSQESSKAVSENDKVLENLSCLNDVANSRRQFRQEHCLVQDDNVDYQYHLNEQLRIESISIGAPTTAHRIVEEAMLATNYCAGTEFARHEINGALYACHLGFRPERLREIQQLLKQEKPDYPTDDVDSFESYTRLIRSLDQNPEDRPLKLVLRRLLQSAEIGTKPLPHFGLGFEHYALITSPIRRYQDLHNHRLIKQALVKEAPAGEEIPPVHTRGQDLQEKNTTIRNAQRELNQRLLCHYLVDKEGQLFDARIMAISSQGLALRLVDNGAESFVILRNSADCKVKYDSLRLTLTVNDTLYQLEQVIKIKLTKVNRETYQLQLSLA